MARWPLDPGLSGASEAEGMAGLVFWLLWLTVTAYLHEQWQRYEPTRVVIDGVAAAAALPLALVASMAVV